LGKVKVFALAKKLGFKSAEFVDILKNIGFPVNSYQASLEEWDVPIIEERLRKGGLLKDGDGTDGAGLGNGPGSGKPLTWDALAAAAQTEAKENEAEDEEETEETPVPTASPSVTEPVPVQPISPAPTPEPEVGTGSPSSPTPSPKPTRKRAATKLGKIDLQKLGLIKSQHQKSKRGSTFTEVRDRDSARRRDQRSRQRDKLKARRQGKVAPTQVSTLARKKDVVLSEPVNVKSFSESTGIGASTLLRSLMKMGVMATINATVDKDTVEILADEFGLNVQYRAEQDIEAELIGEIMAARQAVDEDSLSSRAPVIAFLGHVDHGKTSLIDAIRDSRIAGKEAGGITQHIGAYRVELSDGRPLTVLDTPGHAAFTSMRARGAHTTDIVVLVVAADDGVMPQTEEAIAHAREAKCPIVVAINKVDAKGANPEQVKSQLSGLGLQAEDWGGEVGMVEVSALKKQGVDNLLERILLEAEVLEAKAHTKGDALGTVIEAKVEKGKGKVVHVLVQDGTLRTRDVVLAGHTYGKIRLMFDHNGQPVKEAGPSTPVEILGLDDLPPIGEPFHVVSDMKAAKAVAEKRLLLKTEQERANKSKVTLQNVFEKLDESQAKRLRFVLKADVLGSLEVLKSTLEEMSTDEIIVDIVHSAVGAVTETDVLLASTAGAIVIAFHIAPDNKARKLAEREGVEIRRHEVIYDLTDEVQQALEGMLEPDTVEEVIGLAEVLDIFSSSRWGSIAGCRIVQGLAKKSCEGRLLRDGKVIHQAPLSSLRHFKDDMREVKEGKECGIKLENFEDIQVGDTIEMIEKVQKARTLEDAQTVSSTEKAT